MRGRIVSGGREAVVALRVLGPAGRHAGEGNSSEAVEVEAVIDTGFTRHLTLPRAMVRSLALPRRGFVDVELADGRTTALDVYEARVLWHGRPRPIPVYETGETGGPLVGMSLLRQPTRGGGRARRRGCHPPAALIPPPIERDMEPTYLALRRHEKTGRTVCGARLAFRFDDPSPEQGDGRLQFLRPE
jgi:clan AA aspartic protease